MNRRTFLKTTAAIAAQTALFSAVNPLNAAAKNPNNRLVSNPYKAVDWNKVEMHKAALHIHTLQSDGHHPVDDVVNSYRKAGYSIMSITDHDTMEPNRHVAPSGSASIPAEMASPYPKDPKPDNYPANTTWQWTDYGCSAPKNLGMIGIEGNELSYRHHINSYFCGCGWAGDDLDRARSDWNDFELQSVHSQGGLAVLCHPGWEREPHRHPLDWYIERFKKHPASSLLGIEVTNNNMQREPYDIGLWDQLLARFMPNRPIWGFGNDDMHRLASTKQTFNSFLLPSLTNTNVRRAMENGQFVFSKSTRSMNYVMDSFSGLDTFPTIKSIEIDEDKGTITINAQDCDQIRWISAPESLEVEGDYKTSLKPWQSGKIVHTGETINYKSTAGIKNYLRAELHRKDGEHTQRTFTNPFGIAAEKVANRG